MRGQSDQPSCPSACCTWRLADALIAYRHREPGAEERGGRTSNNNGVSARCDCGRRIRTARATDAAGPIICGLCGAEFCGVA